MSLPSRGAWIEIPTGAGGTVSLERRSPRGERGLKCLRNLRDEVVALSLPSRGAWIEIRRCSAAWCIRTVAPLAGSVD